MPRTCHPADRLPSVHIPPNQLLLCYLCSTQILAILPARTHTPLGSRRKGEKRLSLGLNLTCHFQPPCCAHSPGSAPRPAGGAGASPAPHRAARGAAPATPSCNLRCGYKQELRFHNIYLVLLCKSRPDLYLNSLPRIIFAMGATYDIVICKPIQCQ